ncbi:hypothetical protein B0H14DRAFT_2587826 [Mycena olivaceomarginata]|nr:hypothetical protein B0H14DRAFT_2587826 [Mycena olivaceomarginata]
MVNTTGANGTDNGVFPPDEEFREILFDFERKSLSHELRLRYLQERHYIKIGYIFTLPVQWLSQVHRVFRLTKLKALNRKFNVPSSHKFHAVEEATEAIADIISRDVYQGQGPDTVKIIAFLRLNLTIPRDFVRGTMKGLVGQRLSDMRCPGRGKGPKIRTALNAIGTSNGPRDRNGMRDHVGKVLLLKVVPNSRLSDTVGHLFLDMVSDFQATSVQVTFDGGGELGWLAAFQTTLREVFAPELSADEWRPVVAVKIQTGLDEFVDYFNNKKTRKQHNRILPSGVAPNVIFDMPGSYGLENLAIPVTQAALDELRGLIDTPREDVFRWVSDKFDEVAMAVYLGIGSPKLEALRVSGWAIFNSMAPLLRGVVDLTHSEEMIISTVPHCMVATVTHNGAPKLA